MTSRTYVEDILSLKNVLRDLNSAGVSYVALADLAGNEISANAIKQFAFRESGTPRMTPLVSRLQKIISAAANIVQDEEVRNKILSQAHAISGPSSNSTFLYNAFDTAQELASALRLQNEYIYVRRFSKSNEIIAIPIHTFKAGGNYVFTMRIVGRKGFRYVYGNILRATHNITLDGFAFEVNELAEKLDLFNIDIFNESDRMKFLADNSHGQETLSFHATSLGSVVFPVGFGGLDRHGFPLVGTGIIINPTGLEGIDTFNLCGVHENIEAFIESAHGHFPVRIKNKIKSAEINTYSVSQDIEMSN